MAHRKISTGSGRLLVANWLLTKVLVVTHDSKAWVELLLLYLRDLAIYPQILILVEIALLVTSARSRQIEVLLQSTINCCLIEIKRVWELLI